MFKNQDRICIVSLDPSTDEVVVHEFRGETSYRAPNTGEEVPCINLLAANEWQVNGMLVEKFLSIYLLDRYDGPNKNLAITKLNTWYWVQVVGNSGKTHGRPMMFRHTMPDRKGTPFWVLQKIQESRGYRLVAFKGPFVCRYSGNEFGRYEGQTQLNVSAPYQVLENEQRRLATILNNRGELNDQTSEFGRILATDLEEVSQMLDRSDMTLEDAERFSDEERDGDIFALELIGGFPRSFQEAWKAGSTVAMGMHAVGMLLKELTGYRPSVYELRSICSPDVWGRDMTNDELIARVDEAVRQNWSGQKSLADYATKF